MVKLFRGMRRRQQLFLLTLILVAAAGVLWTIVYATTRPSHVVVTLRVPDLRRSTAVLDRTRMTNDGQVVSILVTLRDRHDRPVCGDLVQLRASAAYMTTASGRTNEHGTVRLRTAVQRGMQHEADSSGLVRLILVDATSGSTLPQPQLLSVYNRVAVLLQGLGTSLSCPYRNCVPGLFQPLVASVLSPLGYRADNPRSTILVYSYRGGSMVRDGGDWFWRPQSYGRCDTAQAISQSSQALRDMLLAFRARYPYTSFELFGHSLGGLVAMQTIGDPAFWQQTGPGAVDKLVTVDSPINGLAKTDALSWMVDAFANVWDLRTCSGQRFGLDLAEGISNLADRAPERQHGWAVTARAGGASILNIANRYDVPVPDSSALLDGTSPVSIVDRIRYSLSPVRDLGHSALLYPRLPGNVDNPDWNDFTSTVRDYYQQSCLSFVARDAVCRYPSIDRGF